MANYDFKTGINGDADGSEGYAAVLGVAGQSMATAKPKRFPVRRAGRPRVLALNPPGRALLLSDAGYDILVSYNPGAVPMTLVRLATLGITVDPTNEEDVCFTFQRRGNGPINVNPVDSTVVINWNNLDPNFMATGHPPVTLLYIGTDGSGNELWSAC
jgi:hypothetical protein